MPGVVLHQYMNKKSKLQLQVIMGPASVFYSTFTEYGSTTCFHNYLLFMETLHVSINNQCLW